MATASALAARDERNHRRTLAALEGLVKDEDLVERLKTTQLQHRDEAWQQSERNEVMADIAEHLLAEYTDSPVGGLDEDVTTMLSQAGYENPEQIREASDDDLLAIKGIGKAKLLEIRETLT